MAENYLYSESIDESIIIEAINSLGEEYEENALYVFLKNELNHRKYDDQYIKKLKNKALRKGFKYYNIQKIIDAILSTNEENN
jgi:SOS response regulatory protein OraA/RecX